MTQDEAWEALLERYECLLLDTLSEYVCKQNTKKHQAWSVVKASDLHVLWNEYMRTSLVLKPRLFAKVREQILTNIVKIRINTELCGHTQLDPNEVADAEIDWDRNEYFFVDQASGHWRISDYAMDKLWALAVRITEADTEEDQLPLLDQALNIVHMRGDLASWFVEGGSKSLTELSEAV